MNIVDFNGLTPAYAMLNWSCYCTIKCLYYKQRYTSVSSPSEKNCFFMFMVHLNICACTIAYIMSLNFKEHIYLLHIGFSSMIVLNFLFKQVLVVKISINMLHHGNTEHEYILDFPCQQCKHNTHGNKQCVFFNKHFKVLHK